MNQLVIEYCTACNYYPRAASLAADLEKKFGLRAELVRSHGGVFEVTFKNDLLFSKKKTGRFPEPGELDRILEARLDAGGTIGA